jgi:tetratricopeptide (TPR) repeat protein
VALAAGACFLGYLVRQADKGRAALREGQAHLERRRPDEAAESLRHGLALVEDLPLPGGLAGELRQHLQVAERARVAVALHALCEQLRPVCGAEGLPPAQAELLARHCAQFWQQRERLRPLERQGDRALEDQVRTDLLDLAILWTHLRVRAARGASRLRGHREALEVLAQAEEWFGSSCTLELERSLHARALGLTDQAEEAVRRSQALPARSAWDHCALGRAFLHSGDLKRAQEELDCALALQPGLLWASFYRGTCALRLREWADAVAAFHACVVLAPDCAWCYHNRGLAYRAAGRADRARVDFDRARALDPSLAASIPRLK